MNSPRPTPLEFLARYQGIIAILIAAIAVRLASLSIWWLNPDEGIYFSLLTRADLSDFWAEVVANAHPPLYYAFLRGLGFLTWDFLWLRVISTVAGLAAVIGIAAVARRLAGEGLRGSAAGFVAALVLAFAPGPVGLSQVMRPYMLLLALLVWAFWFLLRYVDEPDDGHLVGYAVLTSLALATHYSAFLALVVFGLLTLNAGRTLGFASPAWKRLLAAHAAPALTGLVLYFLLLRPLWNSTLADEALDGWLSYYMIGAPSDVWWSFLGFQHMMAASWIRGPAAILLLLAMGVSIATRDVRMIIVSVGAWLVAILAATVGVYPLGSTRHSTWLLTFAVPTLGWMVAQILDTPPGERSTPRVAALAALVLLGGPLGSAVGMRYTRLAQSERVVRQADLADMIDHLDPAGEPELVVMSEQTFYLLLPFWAREREEAVFSPDSSAFVFPYGNRHVLVSDAWDFTTESTAGEPGTHSTDGVFAAHLGSFLDSASAAFPGLRIDDRETALLLVGGWQSAFQFEIQRLAQGRTFMRRREGVPGFFAFEVELAPVRALLGSP